MSHMDAGESPDEIWRIRACLGKSTVRLVDESVCLVELPPQIAGPSEQSHT
jgi:hypothetical protein